MGIFDIRSFYDTLRGPSSNTFLWKGIWVLKAPGKFPFFFLFCLDGGLGEDTHW